MATPNLTIGITTFRRRFDLVADYVRQLRLHCPEVPILITVNADFGEEFDETFRTAILELCASHSRVFPFVFPTFTSLAKMWNTLLVNSPTDHILITNDDIECTARTFLDDSLSFLSRRRGILDPTRDLFTINGSWSHFVIGKALGDALGYFDERLLAFGEEDGDFAWRFEERFGQRPSDLSSSGVQNTQEGYRVVSHHLAVEDRGPVFRPVFNRRFIEMKYGPTESGPVGLFGQPRARLLPDDKLYPYQRFKDINFARLSDNGPITLDTPPVRGRFRMKFWGRRSHAFWRKVGSKVVRLLRGGGR